MIATTIILLLALVGLIQLAKLIYAPLKFAYRTTHSLKKLLPTYGKNTWAVVTGATDGIGLGFANVLAELKFNIVLISRTQQKLDLTARKLAAKYRISCLCVQADFTDTKNNNIEFFDNIMKKINHLDISILINNVGTSVGGDFLKQADDTYFNLVNINCLSMLFMTKRLLPKLLNRFDKKNRSAIINISSITGEYPQPYAAVYSGSKAFNDYFSICLSEEFKAQKIDILSVRPCAVQTPLTRFTKQHFSITPEQCAQGALKYLGREYFTNGHFVHNLQSWSMKLIPTSIMLPFFGKKSKEFYDSWEKIDAEKAFKILQEGAGAQDLSDKKQKLL